MSPEFSTSPCWHSYGFHFCSWPNAQHCSSDKASTWIAYFFFFFSCQFLTASVVSFALQETALWCLSGIHLPFSPTALPSSGYCVTYNFSSPCLPSQTENQLSTAFVLFSWHLSLHGSPSSVPFHCRFLSWRLMCTLLCGHHSFCLESQ